MTDAPRISPRETLAELRDLFTNVGMIPDRRARLEALLERLESLLGAAEQDSQRHTLVRRAVEQQEAFIAGVDWQRRLGVELIGQTVRPKQENRSAEARLRYPEPPPLLADAARGASGQPQEEEPK